MKKLAYLITLLILTSVSLHGQNVIFLEHRQKELLRKNKTKQITESKIGLDKNGNSRWKRIESVTYYNQSGLIVMGIFPKYSMNVPANKGGMTIDELSNFQYFETNFPTGEIDTVLYTYNQLENLTSIKDRNTKTLFKYDSYNNIIEKCYKSELYETVCHYTKYTYNNQNKIISKIDSFGVSSFNKGYKKPNIYSKLEYDKNLNVIFDGEFKKIYNENNQLISFYYTRDLSRGKVFYYYDNGVRLNHITGDENYQTDTYLYYNYQDLVQEKKTLDKNGKLKSLLKYEYKTF
jgi:YD repeat-containing protein